MNYENEIDFQNHQSELSYSELEQYENEKHHQHLLDMENTRIKQLKFSKFWPEKMGEWAGKETYFRKKIWAMLIPNSSAEIMYEWGIDYGEKVKYAEPKFHTIRRGNKYKAGDIVSPISVDQNGNEFQFAPEMEIISIQDISIRYEKMASGEWVHIVIGGINGMDLPYFFTEDYNNSRLEAFIKNDGFESPEQFFKYFNEDFEGQILHFTDLRY